MFTSKISDHIKIEHLQIGDNGHIEKAWSTDCIREQILQLNFQLTRDCSEEVIYKFKNIINTVIEQYNNALVSLTNETNNTQVVTFAFYQELIITMYKMIGYTRDIIHGKGEYNISYHLLIIWYLYFPESAKYMLYCFVYGQNENDTNENGTNEKISHPYGSWKDIKQIADICYEEDMKNDEERYKPLIDYCVELINTQLKKDHELLKESIRTNSEVSYSLVSKWIPREKSKYAWLFSRLAEDYYKEYIKYEYMSNTSITCKSFITCKSILKCKMEYRKLISSLNRKIDTVQVKQCSRHWKDIVPENQTSITLHKQKRAFLQNSDTEDRALCSQHFKEYICDNTKIKKGKRIGINDFVKDAFNVSDPFEITLLNQQWKNHSEQTPVLQTMIPIIDVSCLQEDESVYAAIGIGIRIAEKSIIGNRVMCFSDTPKWINLDGLVNFVDKVQLIKHHMYGTHSNFYAAMEIITNTIVEEKLPPHDVEDMTFVILSDMQIEPNEKVYCNKKLIMYQTIKEMYAQAGMKTFGKAYRPPHIVFWNVRSTDGFPNAFDTQNSSMISGFSTNPLNIFPNTGSHAFRTPWSMFMKLLSSNRYTMLEKYMINVNK